MSGRGVIGAKVRAPDVRGLSRERLHEQLGRVWEHRFGLVVAPAGSGKTTLLSQFAASVESPVAWYRAEASDATEASLVAHLAAACEGHLPGIEVGWQSVDDLIGAAERWSGRGALVVIDEIDALWGTEAEAAIERLIDYLPRGWALVASARRAPGLNLSRLRVNGNLIEIGPEDLRFRFWEVERLFSDFYNEPLPPDQLAELTRRTEGWAAGLQLFHLATRGQPTRERGRMLGELGRRSRLMRDYLAANVLDQLPSELRSFLLETCVLGRLTASLCDEVTGRRDSARVLTELEDARLFTHRTEGDAFRYHEVLRSHLEASLIDAVGEAGARARFRAAGRLLEREGAVPDALRAYCRAEDWEALVGLLGHRGEEAVDATGDWIDLLPPGLLDQDPWLLLGSARRYLSTGRWPSAIEAYHLAERLFGHGQSAALCRREREALTAWLEPVGSAGADWTGQLRSAVRRDPAAATAGLAGADDPAGRFARAVGLLIAGDVRTAGRLLDAVGADGRLSPVLSVAAEVAGVVAAMLAGSPVVVDLDRLGERAEDSGLPWMAELARSIVRAGGMPTDDHKVDPWLPALAALLGGLRTLLAGGRVTAPLDEVADELRRLGAPVLESWARSTHALVVARHGGPGAAMLARDAEVRARSASVPGSLVVALAALALAEPDHQAAHLAAARTLADSTGIDLWRLVGPRRADHSFEPRARVVGRDRETGEMRAYVDGLMVGRGRTVLVSGPSGIGKTRLAEDVAAHAKQLGATVLWGQAAPGAGPYAVFGQILRSHLMSHDLLDEPVRPDDLPGLSRLVPELPELLPSAPLELDAEISQQAVFEAAASFFSGLSAQRPVLVVVDDLHQADPTSRRLFDFLARVLVSRPVMLLGTHQEVPGAGLSELTAASRIRLGGLSAAAIAELVRDVAGEVPGDQLTAALSELTSGNPFFLLEMVRTLAAERPGELAELGRADLRIPPSLRDVALGRVGSLSAEASALMLLASAAGRTFNIAVLEAAAGERIDVLELIGEARAAGIVEEDGPAPGAYRFTHGLLQEALYESLSPVERAEGHNRIGAAIESLGSPLLDARLPELAHHLLLGASRGDRARAAAYARRAAAQALEHAAYEDALNWSASALEALSGVRGHTELRRRLLDLSAEAEEALGDAERAAGLRAAALDLPAEDADVGDLEAVGGDPALRPTGSDVVARCFGPLEVTLPSGPVDIGAMKPRVRSLLRFLLLRAGEAVHREQIVDALWPGADLKTATRSLQTAVSALRQALEPGVGRGGASVVVRQGDAYRLRLPDGGVTDVMELERVSARALAASDGVVELAEQAVALHRGPLFDEEGPVDWVVGERERLRLRVAEVAEHGGRAALTAGDLAAAVRLLERGLEADRWRDGLWRALVETHEAQGDKAAAARAAQQYELVLAELGVAR